MGFRNPFRSPGRRERRRVHHRLLAGRATPRSAAAGRQASAGSRSFGIRPTTAIRSVTRARPRLLPVELPGVLRATAPTTRGHPAGQPAAADRVWRVVRSSTTRAGSRDGGPGIEPGLRTRRRHRSGDLVLLQRQPSRQPARHAVLRVLRDDPRADRAGLVHRVPAALPRALHGRRRSARRHEVPLRPGQPEHDEVPALLPRLGHLR